MRAFGGLLCGMKTDPFPIGCGGTSPAIGPDFTADLIIGALGCDSEADPLSVADSPDIH